MGDGIVKKLQMTAADKAAYDQAGKNHRVACGGPWIRPDEWMAESPEERDSYAKWLTKQAKDVRKESRNEK